MRREVGWVGEGRRDVGGGRVGGVGWVSGGGKEGRLAN